MLQSKYIHTTHSIRIYCIRRHIPVPFRVSAYNRPHTFFRTLLALNSTRTTLAGFNNMRSMPGCYYSSAGYLPVTYSSSPALLQSEWVNQAIRSSHVKILGHSSLAEIYREMRVTAMALTQCAVNMYVFHVSITRHSPEAWVARRDVPIRNNTQPWNIK